MGLKMMIREKVKGMEMIMVVRKGLVKRTAKKLRVRKIVVMMEMMVEAVSELKELVIRPFGQAQRADRQAVHCCHW